VTRSHRGLRWMSPAPDGWLAALAAPRWAEMVDRRLVLVGSTYLRLTCIDLSFGPDGLGRAAA
jgi:hypothetical protein